MVLLNKSLYSHVERKIMLQVGISFRQSANSLDV